MQKRISALDPEPPLSASVPQRARRCDSRNTRGSRVGSGPVIQHRYQAASCDVLGAPAARTFAAGVTADRSGAPIDAASEEL